MVTQSPPTHIAYTLKREDRAAFRWLEIGTARVVNDGTAGHHVYIDRLPVGGFSGHVYLSPLGVMPPDPDLQPQRPGQVSGEADSRL